MRSTYLISLLLVMVLGGCQTVTDQGVIDDGVPDNVRRNPDTMIFVDSVDKCPQYVRDINDQGNGNPAPRCEEKNGNAKLRSDAICRMADQKERITWRVYKGGNPSFTIDFKSGTVPSGWKCYPDNNTFTCMIEADNETPGATYQYSVTVGNCELDPEIIFH